LWNEELFLYAFTVKNNKMITKIIRKKKKLWPYFQIIYILPMVITDGNKGDYL